MNKKQTLRFGYTIVGILASTYLFGCADKLSKDADEAVNQLIVDWNKPCQYKFDVRQSEVLMPNASYRLSEYKSTTSQGVITSNRYEDLNKFCSQGGWCTEEVIGDYTTSGGNASEKFYKMTLMGVFKNVKFKPSEKMLELSKSCPQDNNDYRLAIGAKSEAKLKEIINKEIKKTATKEFLIVSFSYIYTVDGYVADVQNHLKKVPTSSINDRAMKAVFEKDISNQNATWKKVVGVYADNNGNFDENPINKFFTHSGNN